MASNIDSVNGKSQLRVSEIFYSLQGESASVGIPTIFIRLVGCPLRCQYCDTTYAFTGGHSLEISEILEHITKYDTPYVTVTGGEPLAQKACLKLLTELCDKQYKVSLETSGAVDVSAVDSRVHKIMDLKTPASGEQDRNLWSNLDHLRVDDQIKFVLCDRDDYEWACNILEQHRLTEKAEILFSPSFQQLDSSLLADWILQDQLKVRFQIQLHKLLWGEQRGR